MGRVTLEPDSLALADNGGDLKVRHTLKQNWLWVGVYGGVARCHRPMRNRPGAAQHMLQQN
jgi:hypothetical protein